MTDSHIGLLATGLVTGLALLGCEEEQPAAEPTTADTPSEQPATGAEAPEVEETEEASPAISLPSEAYGTYEIDPVHSSVVFRGDHFGLGYVYGLFNDVQGTFELKEDPTQSSVRLEIAAASLFTGNQQRDQHLKSPDFLNADQFPKIVFESTSITRTNEGFEVSGDLTLRGTTKPATIRMSHVGSGPFQMDDSYRTGFHGEVSIDRMEYEVDHFEDAMAPEVQLIAAIEGVQQ